MNAITLIPISEIRVVNPRSRNRISFNAIRQSIASVGLKKPITVQQRDIAEDGTRYNLVCGQGRLEALRELGETMIPALIKQAPEDECYLMSLIENLARRAPGTGELLREVKRLTSDGHTPNAIAERLGMDKSYIRGIARLLRSGEDDLIHRVEAGQLPIDTAIKIATGKDEEIQRALTEAYENGTLRGAKLRAVQQLLLRRKGQKDAPAKRMLTGEELLRTFEHPHSAATRACPSIRSNHPTARRTQCGRPATPRGRIPSYPPSRRATRPLPGATRDAHTARIMSVKRAFQPQINTISLNEIIPIKKTPASARSTETYKRIEASIDSVGLIEPLVVFPTQRDTYVLLDGHTRYDVLTRKQIATADCLLATDNESYTYNKRVNYIPPIAQHYMILRALAHVGEERIAQALNVSVSTIREKRDLLKGICTEAADLLRNERVTADAFHTLRKMKPLRQITVAQLMISAKKFSGRFARALLASTPEALLEQPAAIRQPLLAPDQQAIIEQETNEMLQHVESIKAHYGNDVLELTATCAYLEQLVTNTRVRAYLVRHHQQTYNTLTQVLDAVTVEREQTVSAPQSAARMDTSASA